MNRTKNASRNIIWGFIERITSILLPFVTRTILIKYLGAEYLGLNSLFSSVLQVLSISELGFGTAIVFSMYKPVAEGNKEMLCALLNTYRKIYNCIGTIILICGLIVTPFITNFIDGTYPKDINIYVLFLLYLINTVISYYLFAYKTALFSAYQRNDLASKRTAIISFVSNILQIIVLIIIENYYAYIIIMPLATILTNLANAYLANKMFPDIVCYGEISEETKKALKKRITGLLSFKIYSVIFNSVDAVVISSFLGLVPLAMYNNYYYIQKSIAGFLNVLTGSITAGVGNKMITNSVDDNYKDFKCFVFAHGWVCSWCAICMFCLYQHFMTWWVGKELTFSFGTMTLMVVYFFIPHITNITYTYREAAGLWWEDRFRPLVATVVNLITNVILVQIIGMNGVIISTLICSVFIHIPWGTIILFKNYFKRSPVEYFCQIIYYIIVTIVIGCITFVTCGLLPVIGLLPMLAKGIICVILPNIMFWFVYRKRKEYEFVRQLMNHYRLRIGKKKL